MLGYALTILIVLSPLILGYILFWNQKQQADGPNDVRHQYALVFLLAGVGLTSFMTIIGLFLYWFAMPLLDSIA